MHMAPSATRKALSSLFPAKCLAGSTGKWWGSGCSQVHDPLWMDNFPAQFPTLTERVWETGGLWVRDEENFSKANETRQVFLKKCLATSLVAQWLRIRLSRQGTQVQSLVRKIPHAAEQLSPWAATKTANSMRGPPTIARVAPIHCDQRELTGSNEDPVSP